MLELVLGVSLLTLAVGIASLLTARGLASLVRRVEASVRTLASLVEKLRHMVKKVDPDPTRVMSDEECRKVGHR